MDAVSADLFAKARNHRVAQARAAESFGLFPYFLEMGSETEPEMICEGRRVITLGSNNYLGLSADPRVKRAAIEAVEQFGSGCTGSRLMNGTLSIHTELEAELIDWMGGEACLVFTTGYAVNLGVMSSLAGRDDRIFVDSAAHASLLDGAQLSAASMRIFRHNSPETLDRRLAAWREGEGNGGALVAVDSVFSMEGDISPLREIAEVCARHEARILVDEAHAVGLLGPEGRGAAAREGVQADLLMGTFSKSLASCGGFLIGPRDVIDHLRISCRPFLFTAAGVPAAMAAALCALRISRAEPWRREAAVANAERLRSGLAELGYGVGAPTGTAIVPVPVGDDWAAARLWRGLLDRGVYTNCALAPAVPAGQALLRTSAIATHTEEQIDRALAAFEEMRSTLG